jgi:hypothetical protein
MLRKFAARAVPTAAYPISESHVTTAVDSDAKCNALGILSPCDARQIQQIYERAISGALRPSEK